jgi:hypothetical protein
MVFRRQGCVAKSSTKVPTLLPPFAKASGDKPGSRLALAPESSFSLSRLSFNGLALAVHVVTFRRVNGWHVSGLRPLTRESAASNGCALARCARCDSMQEEIMSDAVNGEYYLDDDGRVRAGASTEGTPFAGIATAATGKVVERHEGYCSVDVIRWCGDVACTFRDWAHSSRKELWVLYCSADGVPRAVELVGAGGFTARWSAREVLHRAFNQKFPRVSLASATENAVAPLEIDLAQREMFARAAAALGIAVDHQVFIGPDGFAELTAAGELVGHSWDAAPNPEMEIPSLEGRNAPPTDQYPTLAAALERRIGTADDAEAVARLLLRGDEQIALAVLHVAEHGDVAGVFPIGCGDHLDESSAQAAFAAGMRGFCHRVIVVASGLGEEWESRIERFLGPTFLDWIGESYLFDSITVLVRPDGRRVWGEITGPRPAPPSRVELAWDEE